VQALISAGYERYLHLGEGAVAGCIPALAAASPSAFGVCVAGVGGRLFPAGDADREFAIESISKLFVFALACHTLGHEQARQKLGVNSTGLPFNSVMAIELNADRTMNPLVMPVPWPPRAWCRVRPLRRNPRASSPRCRDSPGGGW
jgi:glutaminase